MAGGYLQVVSKGTKGAYVRKQPKVSKYKRVYKSRYTTHRGNATSKAMKIDRSPFPQHKYVVMPYSDIVTLTTAVGTGYPGVHTFNPNSCYDPNTTGTGHQPLYYDQLGLVYRTYRVLGFSYKVTFFNHDTNSNYQVGVMMTADTAYDPSSLSMIYTDEKRGAIVKNYSYQTGKLEMKGYMPINKLFGITKSQLLAERDYSAFFSTNPTMITRFHVMASDVSATSGAIKAKVEFKYYCRVEDPLIVATS